MSTASAPRPRGRWVLPVVAGLLLIAVGIGAYFLWWRTRSDMAGAMAANTRGVGLMEQFKYDAARAEFEEAVRLAPDWTPARINLGIALLNQQPDQVKELAAPVEQAKVIFREVLAKDPDNKHAHYCLGVIEQYVGRYPAAYEHYVVVNRLDPDDPYTWLRLGACHPSGPLAAEAREYYLKALRGDPYLYEARYRLFQALQRDDPEAARPHLKEFESLRAAEWESYSRLERYSEQGKYADVIGRDPSVAGKPAVGPLPTFEAPAGFGVTLAAGARWATAGDLDPVRRSARARFGGTVVLFDFDRDGRPDVFLASAVVQDGKVRDLLLRNAGGPSFVDVTVAAGLSAPRPSLGAAAGDYDNDGLPDLVVTGAGEQHLFRNRGDGTFADVSTAAGLDQVKGVCLGCAWADLDQDVDLDLVICRYAGSPDGASGFEAPAAGGGLVLFENVGQAVPVPADSPHLPLTTRFQADDRVPKAAGPCAAVSVVVTDIDGDQDLDLLVLADQAPPMIVENDRLMRFRNGAPAWAADLAHRWNGGLVLSATHGERSDLLLARADGPPAYRTVKGPRDFAAGTTNAAALRQATVIDVDMDGWPDVVGLGSGDGPVLLHNLGDGRLENAAGAFGLPESLPADVRGLACADLDGDGAPDLLLWSDAGLAVRRNQGNGNKALLVSPTGKRDPGKSQRTNADGIGCRIIAQSGPHWTAAERTTTTAGMGQSLVPTALGMGKAGQADTVRIRWPDGVIQAELALATGIVAQVREENRKTTSCPVLMTWDGERYVFVTDFLGAGAMGEMGPDGTARPPRPEESVKIEPSQLKLVNGQYRLKVTEPMDEVIYLDHLRLDVVDHPAASVVFPDERFATSDPQPTQELLVFRDRRFPKKAADHRGNDVAGRALERDRRAPDGFHLRSWLGFAEDHSLTFDFGDLPAAKNWHFVWAGWTEYPYSESIYAAERAGVPVKFPIVERLAADGKTWELLGDLGFPAGLPRVMTRPLDIKPGPCVLRVRTNMQVYFDQVYLAPAEDLGIKVHALEVSRADLVARGIIQEVFPDGRPPVAYDDAKTEAVPMTRWKGKLTRTGDVTELLTAGDDRFVLFGPGDEVTVRFDAGKLPPVPAGWERSFVLRSRGYSKDTAPFTATWGNTLPLPFRAMKNYPDFGGVQPPRTDADRWNTRPFGGR